MIRRACDAAGATEVFVTDDAEEGEMFVEARRAAFPAIEARGVAAAGGRRGAGAAPARPAGRASRRSRSEHDVEIPVVAHAGDGNTHPIIVYDAARRRTPSGGPARRSTRSSQAAIALGGTITGEHGVGRAKKGALPDQLGPDVMALTRRIKDALDPNGILNPGAIL